MANHTHERIGWIGPELSLKPMANLLSLGKRLFHLHASLSLLVLTACSFHSKPPLIQSIGPAPRANTNPGPDGCLVVYSAWSNFVDPGSSGHHSRFTISADDGAMSKEIINHLDRFDEGPVRLALPAGGYHVRARSAHFGRVNVPVLIKERQITFVWLDGSFHPEAPSARESNAVKLPDGEIVGWSATVATDTAN